MAQIGKSVGIGGVNVEADVTAVRTLLIRHKAWLPATSVPAATGKYEKALGETIKLFQQHACSLLRPDGRVDPNGFTLKRLNLASIPKPSHKVFSAQCWGGRGAGLLESDLLAASKQLSCELAAIKAVVEVEVSSRGAWDDEFGRPTILYERHKFKNHTNGAFNTTHRDISGGYSPRSYGKFRQALKSASWGAFQILGENFKAAGFSSVEAFVDAMLDSEQKHLKAFVSFIKANAILLKAIQAKDWAKFARYYNGPRYADNNYDKKLATAYKRHSPPAKPTHAKPAAASKKPAASASH